MSYPDARGGMGMNGVGADGFTGAVRAAMKGGKTLDGAIYEVMYGAGGPGPSAGFGTGEAATTGGFSGGIHTAGHTGQGYSNISNHMTKGMMGY